MTVQFKGRRSGFQFLALAVACLAVLLAQAARPSDTVSENQILARAKSLFGRPTPADSHIFLIGEGFGARFWFDATGRLFRTDVSPVKYLKDDNAEHDPSDPEITASDSERLISKLSEIARIGNHEWDGSGFSGAGTDYWTAKYASAYVKFGRRTQGRVTGFTILYILSWTGRVTWKSEDRLTDENRFGVIGIDKERYLLAPEDWRKIEIGEETSFLGSRDSLLSYDKHDHHRPM